MGRNTGGERGVKDEQGLAVHHIRIMTLCSIILCVANMITVQGTTAKKRYWGGTKVLSIT